MEDQAGWFNFHYASTVRMAFTGIKNRTEKLYRTDGDEIRINTKKYRKCPLCKGQIAYFMV